MKNVHVILRGWTNWTRRVICRVFLQVLHTDCYLCAILKVAGQIGHAVLFAVYFYKFYRNKLRVHRSLLQFK